MTRRPLVLALLLALATPAPAAAATPPSGSYDCVIGFSATLFGRLTVKGKAYRHRGTKGRISGTKSNLRIRGGDLDGLRGRWYRTSDGKVEIALRNPRDDFESIYCTSI